MWTRRRWTGTNECLSRLDSCRCLMQTWSMREAGPEDGEDFAGWKRRFEFSKGVPFHGLTIRTKLFALVRARCVSNTKCCHIKSDTVAQVSKKTWPGSAQQSGGCQTRTVETHPVGFTLRKTIVWLRPDSENCRSAKPRSLSRQSDRGHSLEATTRRFVTPPGFQGCFFGGQIQATWAELGNWVCEPSCSYMMIVSSGTAKRAIRQTNILAASLHRITIFGHCALRGCPCRHQKLIWAVTLRGTQNVIMWRAFRVLRLLSERTLPLVFAPSHVWHAPEMITSLQSSSGYVRALDTCQCCRTPPLRLR